MVDEIEPLPKWMMRKYALLWRTFKTDPFTAKDCISAIKEDRSIILVLLSRMRQKGWIKVDFDKEDARRRIYTLTPIQKIMELMEE